MAHPSEMNVGSVEMKQNKHPRTRKIVCSPVQQCGDMARLLRYRLTLFLTNGKPLVAVVELGWPFRYAQCDWCIA